MKQSMRAALAAAGLLLAGCDRHSVPRPAYVAASVAQTTVFPARRRPFRTLTIEAATDVSFIRPFVLDFQASHPDVAVAYHDEISSVLFARAMASCRRGGGSPDLYLTVATDHLVRLANDGCGRSVGDQMPLVPGWREWRHEVFAFALEPAVFVYNRRVVDRAHLPLDHAGLIAALRDDPARWSGRVGTYDINQSGLGFNYAESDRRQSASFGRLMEGLGRSRVRLYCCSNVMTAAVARGEIGLAYNVQLSYAYAAARRDPAVGVVVPQDYQAVQTRSVMIPAQAGDPALATAFIDYLLSSRAEAIDQRMLNLTGVPATTRFIPTERLLSQADVSVAMLRLQDPARRAALLGEWNQAMRQQAMPPR